MDQLQKCIHKGILLKRCRLSWRPRYVEMVLDPCSVTAGHVCAHQLILYDQHRHMIKNKISFEDIVTVRSCRDCIFQVFISDGKILQFRSESVESQAHWMAALKVGLGKGHIFHVRVHTSSGLDHALLYSIGVNLPAHRVGQLDRVLVLASPINDINLNAWDLNRVKAFMESDVGIRMDMCSSCIRGGQSDRITFIMAKKFINDCILFLLREARIRDKPQLENGMRLYKVPHQCGHIKQPDTPAPPLPPPYTEDDNIANLEVSYENLFHSPSIGPIKPAYPMKLWDDESTQSEAGSLSRDFAKLSIQADGTITNFRSHLPPRTIPRLNYESSIPAIAHPYIKFQPHMYHQSRSHYEAPYQISSRIIITDSGEVQFERNIMGNAPPQERRGLLYKKEMPLPPKGVRANPGLLQSSRVKESTHGGKLSRVDKEEVYPSSAGAQFLSKTPHKSKPRPPAPPSPEEPSLVHTGTASDSTKSFNEAGPTHPPVSSPLLSTSASRLVTSTSDMGLVAQTTSYSITNLFPKTHSTPPRPLNQIVKRTSSDSELSSLSRVDTQYSNWTSRYGNRTVASTSMKRASEVSDTSDVYIIPTPPSSITSFRESWSENPISTSYVRDSEFLRDRPTVSSPLTDNDCAFLSKENDHDYINGAYIQEKLSRRNSTDGVQGIQKNALLPSVSLPPNTTATDCINLDASEANTPRSNSTALPTSPQQRKPRPRPRKNTLPSISSANNIPEENDSKPECQNTIQNVNESSTIVSAVSQTHESSTLLSPKRVTFSPEKEQTITVSEKLSLSSTPPQFKSRSLPRKPPVPKPRKLLTTGDTNLFNMSHLSTSDGELRSLGLNNDPYRNRATATIMYDGIQVGVTDL